MTERRRIADTLTEQKERLAAAKTDYLRSSENLKEVTLSVFSF